MIIYVLDDGETWTMTKPTPVAVTPEQLTRIERGEKIYDLIPDWDKLNPTCNCKVCTKERWDNHQLILAQKRAKEEQ